MKVELAILACVFLSCAFGMLPEETCSTMKMMYKKNDCCGSPEKLAEDGKIECGKMKGIYKNYHCCPGKEKPKVEAATTEGPCWNIITTHVTDADMFYNTYVENIGPIGVSPPYNAIIAAWSFDAEALEGPLPGSTIGVQYWEDCSLAPQWYTSPEYQAWIPYRLASTGKIDEAMPFSPTAFSTTAAFGPPGNNSAYVTIFTDPLDNEAWQTYFEGVGGTVAMYGGTLLAFGPYSNLEGSVHLPGTDRSYAILGVVMFENRAAARTWYNSAEYQAVKPYRMDGSNHPTMFTLSGAE